MVSIYQVTFDGDHVWCVEASCARVALNRVLGGEFGQRIHALYTCVNVERIEKNMTMNEYKQLNIKGSGSRKEAA